MLGTLAVLLVVVVVVGVSAGLAPVLEQRLDTNHMKRASSLGVLNMADKTPGDIFQGRDNRVRLSRDLSASHTDLAL
ncbi:unnamed protein product [Arctogadus glacialis]